MRKRREREPRTEGAKIRKRGIKVQLLEAFWSMVSPLNQHQQGYGEEGGGGEGSQGSPIFLILNTINTFSSS